MSYLETIDVTVIEPRRKHPTIFETFDRLNSGESFLIINDHDPKPLYYQLINERGNIFNWEYLENGPEKWKVVISKSNQEDKEKTIGELVAADYRKADVFKKYKIDFCCGGKKTLSQVCNDKNIDKDAVESELENINSQSTGNVNLYSEWSLDFLVDYIINTHHRYVVNSIPLLLEYSKKVARVHGEQHPEVVTIFELVSEAAEELYSHMMKEEKVLFPYIKQLVQDKINARSSCSFGTVKNPVTMMEIEHDLVGNIFKTIRELSNDYTPPESACATYRVMYFKLQEFENDLHQHIHLENNILFPAAIKLEAGLS